MSGTSLDGIDVALIRTDGETVSEIGPALTVPYSAAQRSALRSVTNLALQEGLSARSSSQAIAAEREVTIAHADAVRKLLEEYEGSAEDVAAIGFHGQTILHRPEAGWTWQMGDGQLLAQELGLTVINDFRSADVAAGGEGAPLAPLYHQALARGVGIQKSDWPVVFLNIGGVANVTWLSEEGDVLAFDTGPGNSLVDDWIRERTGRDFDEGGAAATRGHADGELLEELLDDPYFARPGPKSLDRLYFSLAAVNGMSVEDGAATLSVFTVESIRRSIDLMPSPPKTWLLCGGGRKNTFFLQLLRKKLNARVWETDQMGWRGDFLEAEAFAFLAVRSLAGLPLSLSTTTGVSYPMTGGVRYDP